MSLWDQRSVKLQIETTLEIIMVTEDLVEVLAGKPLESMEVTVRNGIVIATKDIGNYTFIKPSDKNRSKFLYFWNCKKNMNETCL